MLRNAKKLGMRNRVITANSFKLTEIGYAFGVLSLHWDLAKTVKLSIMFLKGTGKNFLAKKKSREAVV
jgi:hypothetical protein